MFKAGFRLAGTALRGSCTATAAVRGRAARGALGDGSAAGRRCFGEAVRSSSSGTQLGEFLQRCGANWGDATEVHEVQRSACERNFTWKVDLPESRLQALRRGESLDSSTFTVSPGGRARFQLFPRGDGHGEDGEDSLSLWLWSDLKDLGSYSLHVGGVERSAGSSSFCRLSEVLRDGEVQVELRLKEPVPASSTAQNAETAVKQSLQLTGLTQAEWHLFDARQLLRDGKLVTSPPFRFHHVLLGDMYLELQPGVPHPEMATVFFKCRVPTMRLRVGLTVGPAFSKSFVASGKSTHEADLKDGACLQVNLEAPGVLGDDEARDIVVKCTLEEVVSIPAPLQDMMPRLDERALWPKRL